MFLIHIYLIVIEFVSVVKLKYVFSLLVKEKKTNKYLKNIIIFIISGCMQTRKPSNYHYYYMYIIDIVFSFTAALKNWTIGQYVCLSQICDIQNRAKKISRSILVLLYFCYTLYPSIIRRSL